jgi:uncharacterized membrane protein YadS
MVYANFINENFNSRFTDGIILSRFINNQNGKSALVIPWFAVLFIVMSGVNSLNNKLSLISTVKSLLFAINRIENGLKIF